MPSRTALRQSVYERLKYDSVFRDRAFEALVELDNGYSLGDVNPETGDVHEIPFMDIFMQVRGAPQHHIRLEDRLLAAVLAAAVHDGRLRCGTLETPGVPFADRETEQNNALLEETVRLHQLSGHRDLESAAFWGGTNGMDGHLKFGSPFTYCGPDESPVCGEATYFPLEVGVCMPDQIYMHLLERRCVARFPYDQNAIVLMEIAPGFEFRDLLEAPKLEALADPPVVKSPAKPKRQKRVKPEWKVREEAMIAAGMTPEDMQRQAVECFERARDNGTS